MRRSHLSRMKLGFACLTLLSLTLAFSAPMPTQAAGPKNAATDSCVGLGLLPPYLNVDPNCVDQSEKGPLQADATMSRSTETVVTWDYTGDVTRVKIFGVYRGMNPDELEWVGTVEPDQEWAYHDSQVFRTKAIYYAVAASLEPHGYVSSAPVTLSFEVSA